MHEARREAYGRISSVMRQVGPSLTWLSEARETLKRLPKLTPSRPVSLFAVLPTWGNQPLLLP